MITETDLIHLRRCIALAEEALRGGHRPFGAVLVSATGEILTEDHNRVGTGDSTQHPEFALSRWAAKHMSQEERVAATVYTSGEHCPMCAAAHGWVGLGRIVYASSSKELNEWLAEFETSTARVRQIPIQDVIRDTQIDGPVAEFSDEIRNLHRCYFAQIRNDTQ